MILSQFQRPQRKKIDPFLLSQLADLARQSIKLAFWRFEPVCITFNQHYVIMSRNQCPPTPISTNLLIVHGRKVGQTAKSPDLYWPITPYNLTDDSMACAC
jgi:hypothetical protein